MKKHYEILGKIECYNCGSNCDLLSVRFNDYSTNGVICRDCLESIEDEDRIKAYCDEVTLDEIEAEVLEAYDGEPLTQYKSFDDFFADVDTYNAVYRDWETDRKSTRLNSSH